MMHLLDTDHCIFLLRGHEAVRRGLAAHADEPACTSIITVAELLFGAHWSARPDANVDAVNKLVDSLEIVPLTRAIANRFGRIKADLYRAGQKLEDPDLLIAATALEHELTLVTHNAAHYERIAKLQMTDWSS